MQSQVRLKYDYFQEGTTVTGVKWHNCGERRNLAPGNEAPIDRPEHLSVRIFAMALRRPPTRVELKADDVEDYDRVRRRRRARLDRARPACAVLASSWSTNSSQHHPRHHARREQIMKERRLQAEQQVMKASQLKSHATPSADLSLGMDSFASSSKKASASERIGYKQPR